jgi:hypothetical protein
MRPGITNVPVCLLRRTRLATIFLRFIAGALACVVLAIVQPQAQQVLSGRADPTHFDLTISNGAVIYERAIHAGDHVTVTSTGQLVLGPFTGVTSTAGKDRDGLGFPLGNSFKVVPNLPTGALLCRIDAHQRDDISWKLCSGTATFTAEQDGHLLFLINSTDTSTHQGYYEIAVTVEPAAPQKTTAP